MYCTYESFADLRKFNLFFGRNSGILWHKIIISIASFISFSLDILKSSKYLRRLMPNSTSLNNLPL